MIDSSAAASGPPPPARLESEIRAFLIGDVRGYTQFTQQHGDEAAARLQAKFGALARAGVEARKGRVIGMWGDEVLAVFESARQAIHAAIELQERFDQASIDDPKVPLHVGIGLDVGEAIRVEQGYQGGALNLAARLCKLAAGGEVLASDGVIHLARKMDGITYIDRGFAELKGFEGEIHVTEVLPEGRAGGAASDSPGTRPDSTQRLRPPIGDFLGAVPTGSLVARDEEVAALRSVLDGVAGGEGQMALITGEPGIGKTRVAQEVMAEALHRGFLLLIGRCAEAERNERYYPLREGLLALKEVAPPALSTQMPRRWPEVLQLIAGQAPENAVRVQAAVTGFVGAVAESAPVAILIDDLQWADTDTLAALLDVSRQTRGLRVLVLAAYRDPRISTEAPDLDRMLRAASRERLFQRMVLRRLSADGTAAMVSSIMGQGGASREFTEFVYRHTEGNPDSVDRMVRSLGGRLKLICEIGAGGMGRVFRAIDSSTGRTVAAKIMFAYGDVDLETLLRFQQEGAVLSTLKHPNIVTVYGSFLDEGTSCIIMELLEGRALGQILAVEQIDLARARALLQQVASALAFAHGRGIVHRDIKPDNVMVLPGDFVKVTDFGIARVRRPEGEPSITRTGMTIGTPLYMAPEQIKGQQVDGRADIYSLGAVMYQMVTGRPPFEGDSPLTIAFKHMKEEPQAPRELNAGVPEDWEAVILKSLAKSPADRFQTAVEMEEAIAALSTGESTTASRTLPLGQPLENAAPSSSLGRARPKTPPTVGRPPSVTPPPPAPVDHPPAQDGTQADTGLASRPPGDEAAQARKRPWKLIGAAGSVVVIAVVVALVLFLSMSSKPAVRTALGSPPVLGMWGTTGPDLGQLNGPMAAASRGDLYVADTGNSRVQEFAPSTDPLRQAGVKGAKQGQMNSPEGLALDAQGNVYVADTDNNRIDKLSPGLTFLEFWGSPGTGTGQLDHPSGVAVDGHDTVYVVDTNNNRIVLYDTHGKLRTSWGALGAGPGQFDHPTGIAVDSQGNVYVADTGNNRIQEFAPTSDPLAQWGTGGSRPGQFRHPLGVAVDQKGFIYIADTGNNRLQVLNANGTFHRKIGTHGPQGGQFIRPAGVSIDTQGNVYVVDSGNDRIQKFGSLDH